MNIAILPLILYVLLDNPCTNLKGIENAISMTEHMHRKTKSEGLFHIRTTYTGCLKINSYHEKHMGKEATRKYISMTCPSASMITWSTSNLA